MELRSRPEVEFVSLLDSQLADADHLAAFQPTMWSWSRTIREAIGLPVESLGRRLGISKQAVSKLEQNEAVGVISLAKLEALADALDCKFVYGFIPRTSFVEAADRRQAQMDEARKAKWKIPAPD